MRLIPQQPAAVVEVYRGNRVESRHQVDVVVCNPIGNIIESWGEPNRLIYPRSAIKAIQALRLIESGAADAFGFNDSQLALACASHNGESFHVETAREMLVQAGVNETCLECGAQAPGRVEDYLSLHENGKVPLALHNNCSGKHAGFISLAVHNGWKHSNYVRIDHPVQRAIAQTLTEVTGYQHGSASYAVDGCSVPTFPLPLNRLAHAFARFGIGEDNNSVRSRAMIRLRDACMGHPEMVAGKGRLCTQLMRILSGQVFVKVGAEGVYVAAFPTLGLGAAIKVRDGSVRAAEVAVSALVARFLSESGSDLNALACPDILNWNKIRTGFLRCDLG